MKAATAAKLVRTTFRTSREMDFFSEKELTAQIGHPKAEWPLVALKEAIDNALDACEDAGVSPRVCVKVDAEGITVNDNGPGISPETVTALLDYSVRVSSREAYVSPTRGAQGNALKTILAMPFVLSGTAGKVTIAARGVRHDIKVKVDPLRQVPVIDRQESPNRLVKNGTSLTMHWPDSACSILADAKARFLQIADDYTFLNPHLTLDLEWFGDAIRTKATDAKWPKWLPSHPTSPHWYTDERFERLVSAYLSHDVDRERTIREFIAEFGGLTGTGKQKAVLGQLELHRAGLSVLRNGEGLDNTRTAALLAAMKAQTRPVKPAALGVIGRHHLEQRFRNLGSEMKSFQYRKLVGETDGVPWVVETAFAWRPKAAGRRLITGVNWSPGIVNPFRQLGKYGESLDSALEQQRAGADEPIVLLLHMVCPRVSYTDRGKSAVVVPSTQADDLQKTDES